MCLASSWPPRHCGRSEATRLSPRKQAGLLRRYAPRNDDEGRRVTSRRQRLHLRVEIRLPFKSDAGQVRHGDVAVLDADAVGETAIGLEQIRIALIAAKAETGRDVERHLVAAM